jgi:tripartite-type tricarboxylate transporter receptor subunit TctC
MKAIALAAGLMLLVFGLPPPSQAQQVPYPSRPIRFVVPFPPGGSADGIARIISQHMTLSMGQQWLVDNRPGADGALAGTLVMKATPDGHTVFFGTNSPLSAVPALRKVPPYDPLKDFTPISLIGRFTFILFTSPTLPAKTLTELIDYARANPGKLNYGTGNTGGIVAMAQLKSLAKLDMAQIPYKGDAPATADMLGGRIQLAFMAPIPALAQARDGRLRMLAVLLPQRSSLVPDVPTIGEAGMPGVSITPWTGLFGPARLPAEVVARLTRELNTVLSRADSREQIGRQGLEVQGTTPSELGDHVRTQLQAWTRIVRESGIPQE